MLIIEKVVKLLDDFHFELFREHVKNISLRSFYPLALIDVIDRDPQVEQDSDKLCKEVYGEDDEKTKKKFFQLAHYTFKLTSHLAKNYPDYLQPNISKIQYLFNTGKLDEATNLAQLTLDVSEKIEDYNTEIKMLNVLIQREVLLESAKQTKKYHERIRELLQYQSAINDVFEHLHTHFRAKGKPPEEGNLDELLEPFARYRTSERYGLQILSRFCTVFGLYYLRKDNFYTPETYEELNQLENALERNDYIVMSYLFTMGHRLSFLKLNYLIRELDRNKILEEANRLIEESEGVQYWNSFVNIPESHSLAVQISHYVSNYMTSYREDHLSLLSSDVISAIEGLKRICENFLGNKMFEKKYTLRHITYSMYYSALLLLGDKDDIKKAIEVLERVLVLYQQFPFHSLIDAIYLNLIFGSFCLKNFGKMNECYKRYKKATRGKAVNPENDLLLHGFYYAAKWLDTERNQYVKKLQDILIKTEKPNLQQTNHLIIAMVKYFKIPIVLGKLH